MTRPGIRCPACGEEMPRGMASCRYCRAPLAPAAITSDSAVPATHPTPEPELSESPPRSSPSVQRKREPRARRSGSEGKAGQTETSGVASEGVITVAAINHCGSGERNAADEGQKAVRRCMACQSLIVRRCVVAAGSNGHARQQSFMES